MDSSTGVQLDSSPEKLLSEYLTLVNRALLENQGKFWFRQAKALNRVFWGGANFRTLIYDRDPKNVVGEFTIHFDPEARTLNLLPPGDHAVAFSWKAPMHYLEDVVAHRPDWYLHRPMMLDWTWLTERVRDEAVSYARERPSLVAGVAGFALGAAVTALALHSRANARSESRRGA